MPLFKDRFYGIMNPENPLAKEACITLSQLMDSNMIFPSYVKPEQEFPLLKNVHRTPRPGDYSAKSLEDLLYRLALHAEIAILPGSVLWGREKYGYICKPISGLSEYFDIVFVWCKDFYNPALEQFLTLASEICSGSPEPSFNR